MENKRIPAVEKTKLKSCGNCLHADWEMMICTENNRCIIGCHEIISNFCPLDDFNRAGISLKVNMNPGENPGRSSLRLAIMITESCPGKPAFKKDITTVMEAGLKLIDILKFTKHHHDYLSWAPEPFACSCRPVCIYHTEGPIVNCVHELLMNLKLLLILVTELKLFFAYLQNGSLTGFQRKRMKKLAFYHPITDEKTYMDYLFDVIVTIERKYLYLEKCRQNKLKSALDSCVQSFMHKCILKDS